MISPKSINRVVGFLFFLMIPLFACKSVKPVALDDSMLLNCWKHSYEEDANGVRTYRQCDYKTYPASRYRNQFTLEKNGEASYLVLAPTDRHYSEDGLWTYKLSSKTLTITNKDGEVQLKFTVEEVTKDKLQLKKI